MTRGSATLGAPLPGRVAPMTVRAGPCQSATVYLLWCVFRPSCAFRRMRGSATAKRPVDGELRPVTVGAGSAHSCTPSDPRNHSPGRGSATAARALSIRSLPTTAAAGSSQPPTPYAPALGEEPMIAGLSVPRNVSRAPLSSAAFEAREYFLEYFEAVFDVPRAIEPFSASSATSELRNTFAGRGSATFSTPFEPEPPIVPVGASHDSTACRLNFARRSSPSASTPGRSRQSPPAGMSASRTQFSHPIAGSRCIGPPAGSFGMGRGPRSSPQPRTLFLIGW